MEQMQCLVLHLILHLMQFLFITIQVQKVDIDCVKIGENIRRKQTTNKELGGWTEGTECVKKMHKFIRSQKQQKLEKVKDHTYKYLAVFKVISTNLPANPYMANKSGTLLLLFYELFLGFLILLCNFHHNLWRHVCCNIVVVLQEWRIVF